MNKLEKEKALKSLQEDIDRAKENIKRKRKAIKLLEADKCHFSIHLDSMWGDYGEDDVIYHAQPGHGLRKAIKDADELFMRTNNRSDVQAWRLIYLVTENGEAIPMDYPEESKRKKKNVENTY